MHCTSRRNPLDPHFAHEPLTTVASWIALSAWGARSGIEFDCRMAWATAAREIEEAARIGGEAEDPAIDALAKGSQA